MPLPQEIREELERKRLEEHKQASRDALWHNVRTAFACIGWSCAGLAIMGYGLHTNDADVGQAAFKGGMVVGYSGILFTLIRWHLKRKERGDS
jgi:hypothetical protein